MGALCCCSRMEDDAEFTSLTESIYQRCCCFQCSRHIFRMMYSVLFHNSDGPEMVAAMQTIGNSSSSSLLGVTEHDIVLDTYRPPPIPPPYDLDPRYIQSLRGKLIASHGKVGISQLHDEESEPLFPSKGSNDEQIMHEHRRNDGDYDHEPKADSPDKKQQSANPMGRVESLMWIRDDEDVCPTCLDGYTNENPKIGTQCGHHFHLGCIYEWMERSNLCPVCDQEMVFNETP